MNPNDDTQDIGDLEESIKNEMGPEGMGQPITELINTTAIVEKPSGGINPQTKESLPKIIKPDDGQDKSQLEKIRKELDSVKPSSIESRTLNELEKVGDKEEIRRKIVEQLGEATKNLTEEEWEERKRELSEETFISYNNWRLPGMNKNGEGSFAWVPVDKIISAPGARPKGWASEFDERDGRLISVAKKITEVENDPNGIEHIFHPEEEAARIKLFSYQGPEGPIFVVQDGTHRVSGSKLAGLTEIPANVEQVTYPQYFFVHNDQEISEWQLLVDRGLVQGSLEDYTTSTGDKMKRFTLNSEVVPWIRNSQAKIIEISKVYEQLYPGSLDNLSVPRDVLIDPVANYFYMENRWDEWASAHNK